MFFQKKTLVLLLTILTTLLLAACGSNTNNTQSNSGGEATPAPSAAPSASPAAERKLTDGLGNEVTVPANPQRIIASYLEDYLVALGVKPVAQWKVSNGIQDYLQDSLKDIPTIPYDLPFEDVTKFEPDLLIVGSSATVEGQKYGQYSKIAPTYVLGDSVVNDWRKALLKMGEVLDKGDEAQKVLDDYEKKAADAKSSIQAKLPGQSVAAIWLVKNKFFIVSDKQSSGSLLYGDLGFQSPAIVKEISAKGTGNWNSISLEKLAELDADHLILINSDKGTGAKALEEPIWKSVKAVKNGNVYEYPRTSSWLYYGPIASSQMIDDVMKDIVNKQ
ncbi:iron-hydroxamate ABC transporter substrate-binding protein [Paenibacillus herberti]|uniref:ABC transporter substrate-binding protein n=1 Tax=Paenibacillus herberti TaxID=1619309 RepID=A0A229NV19_9BACL|nr:iron-hydroxamate ABC transporter substrate-binding protein [Paenibacillus herberti]OXM13459.1 ABC transporter substrate-binding protein [Paenibacillus herberti]